MWFVYLIKCSNGTVYVGCTSDLEERIKRHNAGNVPSTRDRLPIVLITYIAFTDKYKAFEFEKYLKGGSGRAFLHKRLV
jgi:predicted GIY-YIG superfamily endonuclease